MRNMIRIILKRYKYPPDKQQEAIKMVMEQAEVLSDVWSDTTHTKPVKEYAVNNSHSELLMAAEPNDGYGKRE